MELKISLCVEILVIDFFVWLFVKKVCKLEVKIGYLLLSQICNIATILCFMFIDMLWGYFVLAKIFASLLITLLVVNNYSLKSIFMVFFSDLFAGITIYGYYEFLGLILKSINLFYLRDTLYFDAIFAGCFVVFYLLLYLLASLVMSNKNLHSFLADVSFFMAGKHIHLKGLIDSGNSVYDKKSNLPVVLISIESLKKYMPLATFKYVNDVLAEHFEKCILVGGKTLYVPIVKVDGCKIVKNGNEKQQKFVIGVVNQKFYDDRRYDCLLHRDFV